MYLILFTCPKCHKELKWAHESASVLCPTCRFWIKATDIKEKDITPYKININDEIDQLTMFV